MRLPRMSGSFAWLLLAVLAGWVQAAAAAAPVLGSEVVRGLHAFDATVEVLEDPEAAYAPEEVDARPGGAAGGFEPATGEQLMRGFTTAATWLRFPLVNDTDGPLDLRVAIDTTWLQHVGFYVRGLHEGPPAWRHELAGVSDPMDEAHRAHRVPTLAVALPPGGSARVLVRVKSNGQSKIELRMQTAHQWLRGERRHALLSGLALGGLLAFAVYSAAQWWILRRPMLVFQGATFALVALYEATYRGYARIVLWPFAAEWSYRAHSVTAAAAVLGLMLYFHARSRGSPIPIPGKPWLYLLAGVEMAVLLGTWFGPYSFFAAVGIANAPLVVLSLTACTWLYQRRRGPGGGLALLVMGVICAGGLLRMAALAFKPMLGLELDFYALALPGMLVGVFVVTALASQQQRQRREARLALQQWRAQAQQRLEEQVVRKTRALNEALGQAEQRAQARKELLAYISHDLRAPVSTILSHLRRMRGGDAPADAERLGAIERTAAYQLALIDDLVDYARDELVPLSLDVQPVQMRTLLDDVAQYADALAQRQHNRFELHLEGPLPGAVLLDGKRLRQALLNLIANAARFTHHGVIGLSLRAQPPGPEDGGAWTLQAEVGDSGAGMSEEELAHVMRALAEDAPTPRGGLGLLIAQRIVQRMGGQLQIASHAGAGTRVAFSWQAPAVAGAAPLSAGPGGTADAGAARLPGAPGLPPLSAQQKQELEALARDGRWSDLHDWVNRLPAEGGAPVLAQVLRQALDRLDFEQIRWIAREG